MMFSILKKIEIFWKKVILGLLVIMRAMKEQRGIL